MRVFIATCLLLLSPIVNAQSSSAFFFDVESTSGSQYSVYIDVKEFESYQIIELRYRALNEAIPWTFLAFYDVGNANRLTNDEIDQEVSNAVSKLNDYLLTEFGESGADIPELPADGLARLKWLIQYGISEKENVLSVINTPT